MLILAQNKTASTFRRYSKGRNRNHGLETKSKTHKRQKIQPSKWREVRVRCGNSTIAISNLREPSILTTIFSARPQSGVTVNKAAKVVIAFQEDQGVLLCLIYCSVFHSRVNTFQKLTIGLWSDTNGFLILS